MTQPSTAPGSGHTRPDTAARASALADELLRQALLEETTAEQAQSRRMAELIADPAAKALVMAMTDRLMRSADTSRAAAGWRSLLSRTGIPRGLGWLNGLMLRLGSLVSQTAPDMVMPAVASRLQKESRGVILSAADPAFTHYLHTRRQGGWRVNVNPLGEAILGEEEATRRQENLLALLGRPDVDYVSVKISAIYSQINLIAWEDTLEGIKERLRPLYRAALPQGKMVNLDMEEYRDLALTLRAFQDLLSEPEFQPLSAGIVLQAYLPDSFPAFQQLAAWARQRVEAGGARIKVRLVKGANLAMERIEAEWHGWNAAPYDSKEETDANYRRLLEYACQPEQTRAVKLGVASHNLFDVALALTLREGLGTQADVEIEMLEGMASHQARTVKKRAGSLLLYAPVVKPRDFESALAYLMRRLDENTARGNFLSGLFAFTPGSAAWEEQRERFHQGWRERLLPDSTPKRLQLPPRKTSGFQNEPDTDWTRPDLRQAWRTAVEKFTPPEPPPLLTTEGISQAVAKAQAAQPAWEARAYATRAELLCRCADVMAAHRMETIALLQREGRKAVADADAEVSEAIDFARYYAATGSLPDGVQSRAHGVVVVAPPWNFPFAIPCSGVLAALAAGNAVLLKPAPEVPRLAWSLAQQLWEAGVPQDVLQYAACADGAEGTSLITHPGVSTVVLTGSIATARLFQSWRPSLRLYAETSGKNALVVSALADRDLAIKDLVRSAFGHSGQKCSAASLAILEAEVYDDADFRRQLKDAAQSLRVASASDPAAVLTSLVQKPEGALLRALTTLEEGEEWLLEPAPCLADPLLWSPGIKLGVAPGSWFHVTECFGPVLGLMRARNLSEAVSLQNATPYGLTAGLHSLDEREIFWWKEQVQAGNLYINRAITGAVVQRQPFGGWKQSGIGPGAKAGGPNYVQMFRSATDVSPPDVARAMVSYHAAWTEHFSQEQDPSALRCESNLFRYRPASGVILRLPAADESTEALARLAAQICQVPLTISRATEESDAVFRARLPELARQAEFLRTVEVPADEVLSASHEAGLNWIHAPFSAQGSLELRHWLREQAISETRHRYGNILHLTEKKVSGRQGGGQNP